MKPAIWISDLTQCQPKGAISREGREGTWIAVDYEVAERKGVMLYALPESGVPPLTLRLNLTGWHEIRLGIFYGGGGGGLVDRTLCAKLSSDAAFTRFRREDFRPGKDGNYPEKALRWSDIAEVFWKCADLTGQELVIAHPPRGEMARRETNLAYVRLMPMEEQALAEWGSEQPAAATKTLIANYDGGSFSQWGISTREDFLAEFECLRESDFDIALYGIAACCRTLYPSKVGTFNPRADWQKRCLKKGIDPLAAAIEAARACGVKLFPQNRLAGLNLPPLFHGAVHAGEFMADHTEWLCAYPDGEPTRHLSFAFPPVRDFYVRLTREWVEDYRADGVNILFSRSDPFVYYEQPVCEAFERQYGQDMRALPASDQRVQQARAGFVTQFLRETRAMLDEAGREQGRYIPACYLVPVNSWPPNMLTPEATESALAECLFHALDVPTWLREGLVDYLVVHLHMYGEHDGTGVQPKIREFTELPRGTRTKVLVDVYPRRMPPRQYRKIALSYYAAGADGLAFWDSYNRYFRASEWAFVKRLGHRDDLPRWEGKGEDYHRTVPLLRLDRFALGREFSMPTDG